MYFPYVYGRASELLAFRSMLADGRPLDLMLPVIEPVLENPARLVTCIDEFEKNSRPLALVFNPDKHELKNAEAFAAWQKAMLPKIRAASHVIPVLRCHSNVKSAAVSKFLSQFPGRQVAIAHASSTLSDAEVSALASNPQVRFQMILGGKITASQVGLIPKSQRVDIDDYFNKQDRNADYAGTELFTDKHKTFSATSVGFGDYASIGSAFSAGGGPAAAIAIHAIFKRPPSGDLWIEHFVSDDKTSGVGSVDRKFVQAAKKLASAVKRRPLEFGTNFALDQYIALAHAEKFPGLPKNKELQIAHHLCLVLDVLNRKI